MGGSTVYIIIYLPSLASYIDPFPPLGPFYMQEGTSTYTCKKREGGMGLDGHTNTYHMQLKTNVPL